MIKLELIGYIGKNAEIKSFSTGNFITFPVAVTEKYTANGEKTENTIWVEVIKKDTNNNLAKFLTKGSKVFISGKPSTKAYISKDTAKASLNLFAQEIEIISSTNTSPQKTVPIENNTGDLPF